ESKRDAEIGAEESGEDSEQPLRRHRTGRGDAEATSKGADERKECERADESSALHQRDALGFERFAPLLIPTRFALIGALHALLGALAPLAAPATACHERRLPLAGPPPRHVPLPPRAAVARARGALFLGPPRLRRLRS